jgi:hypothetical protein
MIKINYINNTHNQTVSFIYMEGVHVSFIYMEGVHMSSK